tara:strand:- start:11087 stop:12067 length:981 start_codon:yes stop_codon:yes gene_type:complete
MNNQNTLHIFGGGVFVKHAVEIAKKFDWKIILRTSNRFIKGLENYDNDPRVKLFSGNSLSDLMNKGGLPESHDVGISFSAPWIIPKKIINLFNNRLYNLHNQPLPKFRGGGGSSWNIMMNDRKGGSCIHLLTPKLDSGEIFALRKFTFPESLSYPKDFDEFISKEAIHLLNEWLTNLLKNGNPGLSIENNDEESEYWPRLNTNIHAWINWSWDINDIQSFCNAFSFPHSGVKTILNGKVVHISRSKIELQKKIFHPYQTGLIYKIIDNKLYVAHPGGTMIIEEYKLESDDSKIRLGDRLYTPINKIEESLLTRIQYSPDGSIFELK